jgi:hypothetical protein
MDEVTLSYKMMKPKLAVTKLERSLLMRLPDRPVSLSDFLNNFFLRVLPLFEGNYSNE